MHRIQVHSSLNLQSRPYPIHRPNSEELHPIQNAVYWKQTIEQGLICNGSIMECGQFKMRAPGRS